MQEHVLKTTDYIYELVDVIDDQAPQVKNDQEVIVIDGRVYERLPKPGDKIYDLQEVIAEQEAVNISQVSLDEDIRKMAAEMAERIAREVIPVIAEKIIREEIEKLKTGI